MKHTIILNDSNPKFGGLEIIVEDMATETTYNLINFLNNKNLVSSFYDLREIYRKAKKQKEENERRREINRIKRKKAQGEEMIELSPFLYDQKYREFPKSEAVQIENGQWIKQTDSIVTYEGITTYRNNHRLEICEDTNGLPSLTHELVNVIKEGHRTMRRYHNFEQFEYIASVGFASEEFINANGFKKCQCGRIYTGEKCNCHIEGLEGYHQEKGSNLTTKEAKTAKIRLGIEFEKAYRITNAEELKAKQTGWRCERDATVTAEYITPIINFDEPKTAFDWIIKTGKQIVDCGVNENCGGHMHLSIQGTKPMDLYDQVKGWRPLLWALYPRRIQGFSSRRGGRADHNTDIGIRNKTLEFRIFPGLQSERTLEFRLRLLHFLITNKAERAEQAIEIINNNEEFHQILLIAYGQNTKRLYELMRRIKVFYDEGIEFGISGTVKEIADNFIKQKEQTMTAEEITIAENDLIHS